MNGCDSKMTNDRHQELQDFKSALINSGLFKHMNGVQYTSQCPYCLDNRQHCYVKIDTASDIPVVFYCHKCIAHGLVKQDFLDRLNLDIKMPKFIGTASPDINNGVSIKVIGDTVTEKHDTSYVREYIESRVGKYPTLEELKIFQYVGDPRKYAFDYLGYGGDGKVFNNRYWFKLTNGNITGRWKDDNCDHRWMKFKTTRVKSSGLYTLKNGIDAYKPITIVIAEGVFDIIGLYYNGNIENGLFIGVAGKDYSKGIKHALSKGIYGDSVHVRIYRDPNVGNDEVYVDPTMCELFKSVDLYYNAFDEDYGIKPDKLDIHKVLNWRGGVRNGYNTRTHKKA